MSYLIVGALFALWVFTDAIGRRLGATAFAWATGTLFLGPFVCPLYLATRPLKHGEIRDGGTAWNVLRNFAILWTMLMAVGSFAYLVEPSEQSVNWASDAERTGLGIGETFGMGTLAFVWFLPTAGAAFLGFLAQKSSAVEIGPTGPLAGRTGEASAMSGWMGILAVAIVALLAVAAVETH